MNQLTLIEKIHVLFKLLFSSPIIIGIFAFSMILMIVLFFYSRFNKKIIKYVFSLIYISLIGFAVFKYGKYFLTGIDSFLTLFMANIYFPIIPVYIVIMFISFIIMIFTLGSRKKSNIVKIINTVFFTIIQMLFALFIYTVEANKIDLSSNTGLYSNEQTMTLLELGVGLFVIWIIILLIILYLKKADKIFKVKHSEEQDDFDEYINDYNEPGVVSSTNSNINSSIDSSSVIPIDNNLGENLAPVFPELSDVMNINTSNNVSVDNGFNNSNNNRFSDNTSTLSKKISVFDGFDFLDVQNQNIERKDDDVEIIDFD